MGSKASNSLSLSILSENAGFDMTSQPLSPRRDDRSPWNTNQGKSCSKEPAFFFQHRGFAGKARGSPVRINAIRQVSNPIFGNSRQRQLVNCLGGVQENRHQRACSVLECMYVCIPYTGTSSRFKGPLPPSPPPHSGYHVHTCTSISLPRLMIMIHHHGIGMAVVIRALRSAEARRRIISRHPDCVLFYSSG